MEREIKIGAKVKLIKSARTIENHPSLSVGDVGTIIHIRKPGGYDIKTDYYAPLLYGIEWSNPITKGHDCDGHCRPDYSSYTEPEEIMVL